MTGIESGDVVNVHGDDLTVDSVDHHNNKIHFESGLTIHGAALHAENVRLR